MIQLSTNTLLRHGTLQVRQGRRSRRILASSLQPSSTRDQSADHTALHGKVLLTAGLAATCMVSNPRLFTRRSQYIQPIPQLLPSCSLNVQALGSLPALADPGVAVQAGQEPRVAVLHLVGARQVAT